VANAQDDAPWTPPAFPERFNLAHYFLGHNLEAGRGDKPAVVTDARSWTYAEVQALANRTANVLTDLGAGPEDRVLIVLPDAIEFVATWFATLQCGAVFAMANPLVPAEDFAYYLDYSRAKVAVVHAAELGKFEEPARRCRTLRALLVVDDATTSRTPDAGSSSGTHGHASFASLVGTASPEFACFPTHRDDVAGWLFTSGTTGKPKGAVHCHHDFAFNTECYAKRVLGMREDDRTLSVPKLFFGYATGTNLMFPFAVGATTILFPERSTPERVFEEIERHRPTVLTSVPTMINQMCRLEGAADPDLSSLRAVLSAGEALPPELDQRWRQTFGVEILDGIGSAELFHIYVSNRPGDVRPGSLGRLVPGYEARVVGPDGTDVPDGEIGVLWVKGDSAALWYWQAHERSKEVLRGDWVVTGDLFRRDDEGYFWYAGRADDLLKIGGIWVSPTEVEDCLLRHEAVRECAVVGVEDEDGLVLSKAFVVPRQGTTPSDALASELQEFVRTTLAPHKYPRLVAWLDALPRNDRGKIERRKLRER